MLEKTIERSPAGVALDTTGPPPAGLAIRELDGWYDDSHVLHAVSLTVLPGEVVTLVGRNGAGKTTTLRAIIGLLRKKHGSIRFGHADIGGLGPRDIARLGIAYVPEERGIYARLNVLENLRLPPVLRQGGMTEAQIFALFPNLQERLSSMGTQLSGGEQQMLAIARVLRTGSRFILLDEPTEGLAPVIVQKIRDTLMHLRSLGYTLLLVEQNLQFAASVTDRYCVLETGRVVDTFDNLHSVDTQTQLRRYLSV